jgi:hypothetical protein
VTASDYQTQKITSSDSASVGWVSNGDGSKALMVSTVPTATTPGIDTAHPADSRIQDGTGTALAVVKAPAALAESDNALAVQAPVLGVTTGAAVVTNAAGTIQQYLRGLVTLIAARIPVLGQALAAASLPVTLASDQSALAVTPAATESHLGEVGGKLTFVALEFTRPNDSTPYSANDVVSNSTSATTIQAMADIARVASGTGYIVKARLSTDKKSITPRIRVHLFNATGANVAADNAQWIDKYADAAKRLGYFDLPAMTTGADTSNSDMSRTFDLTLRIPVVAAANRSIYWVLEALDAFTPAALQKFTLELTMDNN